jgi:hypothetical protein
MLRIPVSVVRSLFLKIEHFSDITLLAGEKQLPKDSKKSSYIKPTLEHLFTNDYRRLMIKSY